MGQPASKMTIVAQNSAAAGNKALVEDENLNITHKMSLAAVILVSTAVTLCILYVGWRYCRRRIEAAVETRISRAITQRAIGVPPVMPNLQANIASANLKPTYGVV